MVGLPGAASASYGRVPASAFSKAENHVWHNSVCAPATLSVWSYRLKRDIGFGLVSIDCAFNDRVKVLKDGQAVRRSGSLALLPFI